tara:strand:+ start:35365 stop:35607 length:243 start_codon:yes stop_codon:yes gene_type:complete
VFYKKEDEMRLNKLSLDIKFALKIKVQEYVKPFIFDDGTPLSCTVTLSQANAIAINKFIKRQHDIPGLIVPRHLWGDRNV